MARLASITSIAASETALKIAPSTVKDDRISEALPGSARISEDFRWSPRISEHLWASLRISEYLRVAVWFGSRLGGCVMEID